MKTERRPDVDRILAEDRRVIDKAINRGIRKALLRHKKDGLPVVISRNGTITLLKPEDIEP
jgi:hypothetical protein